LQYYKALHRRALVLPAVLFFEGKTLHLQLLMRFRSLWFFAVAITVSLTACNGFSKVMKSQDYDYKLGKADEYFGRKKYKFAQQLFEELFPVYKGTQRFEDLYYKYAYCFYNQGFYAEAENLFKGYLEVFPNSPRSEEVEYMRCYCFYKLSPKIELEQVNTTKVIGMMQTFINTHPGSARNEQAAQIIEQSREKLEQKAYRSAKLYFEMGRFRAAGLAFNNLLNDFPETVHADEYKLMVVKSYYKFATMSVQDKQVERYQKVIEEYQDFADRYPESKWLGEANNISIQSQNQIKLIQNEQVSSSVKR